MDSFPPGGIAVVIGATGGIGAALVERLREMLAFADVVGLSRQSGPSLDVTSEPSIAAAVKFLGGAEIRLVIDATGFLHGEGFAPEKSFREISAAHMAKSFAVNAVGPALLMKYLLPLLPRNGKAVFATLSARVGSIGDNNIGGWYSYRAAKAALNQLVHTAAIELKRTRPEAICVALHPGTVATGLSAPFAKAGLNVRAPEDSAVDLLAVIEGLAPAQSGGFFDYKGNEVPW
jgi:NAD(P)-dependent dehydrogenase (short-subunit alcohol dehydrogenase family)